jgi:nucleoside-diphosphate-sugar epimerase
VDGGAGVILVTGASGFVGTRLCEHLRLGLDRPVRAVVHRPERAARLARLDVELTRELDASGCDAVVHLAYASEGSARDRRRLTAELARDAAEAAGSRRLVHVSTAAVWGFDARGVLDESVPLRRTGHPYVDGKIDAEGAVRETSPNHVVLRPTNVWGPWGPAFTIGPVTALREGRVALVGDGAGAANVIYVDNLVHAILRALESPPGTFVVNDGGEPTWRGLYDAYASLGGWQARSVPAGEARENRVVQSVRSAATSAPVRAVARRLLPPATQARAREAVVASSEFPSPELAALQTSGVRYRTDLARDVLGYDPPVSFERGLDLTADWLRFARLL